MSSMTDRGGDNVVRDDAIDLHDEDEEDQQPNTASNGKKLAIAAPVEDEEEFDEFITSEGPIVIDDDEHYEGTPEQNGENTLASPDSDVDAGSIPDDTPSIQSSPSSALGRSPSSLSSSPHRPFDLRFQTRLSVSLPTTTARSVSPSLLQVHSRHSSLASQFRTLTPDLAEDTPPAPWEAVRWTKLRKVANQVLSEAGKRSFGRPTCLAVSTNIIIGTTKGTILVFDYQQNLKGIIGPGTKAVSSGSITSLAISADHSTVAGGHADGSIFTWEISKPSRPFLHIPPMVTDQKDFKRLDGHVYGVAVIHIGFLGTRRTAIVSADDHGMAFSHLATRGMGSVARIVKTTRILGRYPDSAPSGGRVKKPSTVLAFSPLPLGNVDQGTDSLGLVAMLTPYLLVIVSTTPVAQTQHKSARPKEVPAHSTMTAALAWFPAIKLKAKDAGVSSTKLVYCWSNVLTILEVLEVKPSDPDDTDKPVGFAFKPFARWRATEPIVAVQWISRSVLAVLTITQQLLILEDRSLRVTESFDLLHKHIYHVDLFSKQLQTLVEQLDEEDQTMHGVTADAFYMSFRAYKGRLFLLGFNDVSVGTLSNWADRLLALMESGDFIGAIRLATAFYIGSAEKLTVGLPEEDNLRHEVVQEKILEMVSASLRYAFGKNEEATNERLHAPELHELAEACIAACDAMNDRDFMFDEIYTWYEENGSENIFLDVLEPYIIQGAIRALPPAAVKALITHFSTTHTSNRLEEIICLLDTDTIDIDQVTTMCKHYNLYDAFIYVWNRAIGDYISPLIELLNLIPDSLVTDGSTESEKTSRANAEKMFPYLSYILTGRIYPTGDELAEPEALKAKTDIYGFLFSGNNSVSRAEHGHAPFKFLQKMLRFDAPQFMSMMNEAFEDNFLNEAEDVENGEQNAVQSANGVSITRQYLISLLLEIMDSSSFTANDTIYLDIFIARNLPKYPQYILLSGSMLQQALIRLCKYPNPDLLEDCQLSAEYLLSTYHPPAILDLIPLFKDAGFYRILKSTYRGEKLYPELLLTYLEDQEEQDHMFTCIRDCLRPGSSLSEKQRRDVRSVMKEHAVDLAHINVVETAHTIQTVAADLHEIFIQALQADPSLQYQYLNSLFAPEWKPSESNAKTDNSLIERYIQLMCQHDPSRVAEFADTLKAGDIHLESILPSIESSGIIDAVVILVAKQGAIGAAMERLIKHLSTLEAGLSGALRKAEDAPQSGYITEAVADLIQSLEKYTRVGIWLCQEQTKSAKRPHRELKLNKRGSIFEQPLTFEENLWLMLIEAVVQVTQNLSPLLESDSQDDAAIKAAPRPKSHTSQSISSAPFKGLVQQVFTALLTTTTKSGRMPNDKPDLSFLRILRVFLTRAASASPSLSELRAVIASILSAYSYEESLLSLTNLMLDKDLFVHVDEIAKLRQRGWRPRGQVCEICRRRVWGPGSGAHVWEAWGAKQAQDAKRKQKQSPKEIQDRDSISRAKGKGVALPEEATSSEAGEGENVTNETVSGAGRGPAIVFGCRHLYHRSCLVEGIERRKQSDPSSSLPESRYPNDSDGSTNLFCLLCI